MTIAMNNHQQARRRRRAAPLALLTAVASAITLSIVIAGTPARAATGTWATETIAGMSVRIYTPATAGTLGVGRALMINLHGCLQKAQNLQDNGNWAATADRTGMIIALPDAPSGGVIAGCWDYYDNSHSSTAPTRHDDNLLDLATTLIGRTTLGIDRNQVYISGLSSGGGETMVMGCLFPRIFAGIGINAGPTVGTSSSQIGSVATTAAAAASTCTNFAGSDSASFQTQLTSVIYGSNDATVAPGYDTLNGEVMANIYGASAKTTFSLSGLPGTNTQGSGTLYSDSNGGRVSVIQNTGLGHNWPAGSGSGGSYISANSIDYPSYLASFFFANNRRVDRSGTPTPTPITRPTPTPTATPTPTPTSTDCITATNLEHKNAGRATSYGINPYNPYYSAGLLGYMGQGDGTVSSLKRKTNGWTVASSCS
ncbi:Esterase PHB depolymerase [Microbacterium azadirachtae]|uniref:Esterase PHB depolymerase n=1 Tax=Microbacterium azadirachtae TaxID=582680 RepID=A0A0F0KUY1_9MICO|nr:PHB depolymerase family esterase [Microbacterium azadirachtae]KJL24279.1 Esterase PHB depolymerase [Microbacterium azadirachtae]